MPYLEYVKLGLAVLGYVIEIIKDLKTQESTGTPADAAQSVDKGFDLLNKIGTVAKVKELQGLDAQGLKPLVSDFVAKIQALKQVSNG